MPVAALISGTGTGGGHTLNLPTIYRQAKAYGPNVALAATPVPALALEIVARNGLQTVLSTLPDTYARRFHDPVNDCGYGEFTIDVDDAAYAQIVMDRVVRFKVKGVTAFAMFVEGLDIATRAQGEEHDQNTKVTGRSHLCQLEEAVVYPARGVNQLPAEENRTYNWSSTVYDDSTWGTATAIGAQSGSFAYWTGLPSGAWPDRTAYWIWASKQSPSYPALDEWSPDGTCYFRHTFTVPAGVSRLHIYFTADAIGHLYLDGAKILTNEADMGGTGDPNTISDTIVDVTPGSHLIAVQATNDVDPEGDMVQNPGGILVAVYSADTQGEDETLITHSSNTWKIVEYPPHPPGMTPGEVMRVSIEEAQARGTLNGILPAFDDTTDSGGNPWPEVTDIATKVGTDYLTFFKELCVTYIDMWLDPVPASATIHYLYAWNKETRGTTRPVTLTAGTNVIDLNHRKST